MASIAGKEVLDSDFNKDRIRIAFNPFPEDETKRFAVQDASHLKDKRWIPDIAEIFKSDFKQMKFLSDYVKDNPSADMDDLAEIITNLKGIGNRQIGVIELDQVANFTYLDTQVNKAVGENAPNVYFGKVLSQCKSGNIEIGNINSEEALYKNLEENCIPKEIVNMTVKDYDEYLIERRKLMAKLIEKYYKGL